MPLNARQQRFVEEYLIDLNATAAYKRAGYRGTGRTAENAASRLLGDVGVQSAIQEARSRQAAKSEVSAVRILEELKRIALADPRKFYNPDGSLKRIVDLDDDAAASLASVEVFEEFEGAGENRQLVGYTKKLKQWDKNSALKTIAQHLGMLIEKHEHNVSGSLEIIEEVIEPDANGTENNPTPPDPA